MWEKKNPLIILGTCGSERSKVKTVCQLNTHLLIIRFYVFADVHELCDSCPFSSFWQLWYPQVEAMARFKNKTAGYRKTTYQRPNREERCQPSVNWWRQIHDRAKNRSLQEFIFNLFWLKKIAEKTRNAKCMF